MEERPANNEMLQGFRDGSDLSNPEPGDNHSYSYRHGFKAGRNDRLPYGKGPFHGMRLKQIKQAADIAMDADEAQLIDW